ncbi:molybdopterin-dependent oxidoreductase alpha subunit [Marinimicrobium koreense]|uniref:Molybdopterin-dependent oxidoreductase alpha subunit n=1 Tax=Marinimicrobium koreense TaxID=306545 RepID=A0A3N1NTZ9_9GAMM|nr:FdhF/YdeP family oxidoreductase [Marinimicrobium koreense]ROQ17980.1 molybdopterin-dependent oxidoreductase alpha subunit [Marinimicrobium koreense]
MSERASETSADPITIVGGGPKKVLYTLRTLSRIGLLNSTKALKARNTCKACGLGMGGQHGGMTNELDEFPSVCNKSIQAQSSDIQPPIPNELFEHTLDDFKELSAHELEHLGRLNTPLYKPAGSNRYQPMDWDQALTLAAERFAATEPNRSFFYSSGRSSNEAGFVLQLLARLYGTNNVNNCSYYCHQATGVGLGNVIGTGTATISLEDMGGADLIFVIGANPASNHPRFVHQLQHCRERGGQVIVINPAREPGLVRFAVPKSARSMLSGGTWIASRYVQPNIGSDLALLKAVGKALLEQHALDTTFIEAHTEGFDAYRTDLEQTDWASLTSACGLDQSDIEALAADYARAEHAVFAWGMGITHHRNGVDNVEAIANLALLRGMLGKPSAGLLPLRGHSNVQGIGTIGVKPVLSEDVLAALESHFDLELPRTQGLDTLACLRAANAGEMDAALLMGGNLYAATPDATFARRALDRVGFKLYLTTTLNQGHIHGMERSEALILPVTARDEEPQSTTQESMFNYVRLSDGGIRRLTNVRSEVAILAELGKRLLPAGPFDFGALREHDRVRSAIAATVPGMEALADIGTSHQEFTIGGRLLTSPTFNTPNGKARFQVHSLPVAREPDFPFTLASIRSEGQFNSIIYEESDSYRGTEHRWCVLVGPEDRERLSLKAGDKATLRSAHGVMENLTVYPFNLPTGSLLAYYPEANILIGTEQDPRSQTPAFKSVPVQLETGT